MGINKNQLQIASDMLADFTVDQVSAISTELDVVKSNVHDINIAQKTVNKQLDYCFSSLISDPSVQENVVVSTVVNDTIKFIPYLKNNIEFDATTFSYTLKANKVYSLEALLRISGPNGRYVYINIYNNTESKWIGTDGLSASTSTLSQSIFETTCIFKPTTDCNVSVRIKINDGQTPTQINVNASYFKIEEVGKEVTIDPVNYINTTQGIEDTPVGNIIQMMGKTAPAHYLICDGTIYNIATYASLSQYIKDQFGTFNFFGGDGITTFAVPDLRGEFLRGTGTGIRNTGSGPDVGIHQDGTSILNSATYRSGTVGQYLPYYITNNGATTTLNGDSTTATAIGRLQISGTLDTSTVGHSAIITTRPTNTGILFCIKYEPTYFMAVQGLIEETVLWSGSKILPVKTGTTVINDDLLLNDSIYNYDEIRFEYCWHRDSDNLDALQEQKIYLCNNVSVNTTIDAFHISLGFSYKFNTSIQLSANNKLHIVQTFGENMTNTTGTSMKINKVVGRKYKTW